MSKIGKVPITIAEKVKVSLEGKVAKIEGPKGVVEVEISDLIKVDISDSKINVTLKSDDAKGPAMWGLTRALLSNAVEGVSKGFSKELELIGVGYRVEKIKDRVIRFSVGYSHPVDVIAPEGITLEVEGNTNVKVSGANKQLVGQVAAEIRAIRPPEPYKGKGIRYKDEIVKRKQGKVAKAIGA